MRTKAFFSVGEVAELVGKNPEALRRMLIADRGPRYYRIGNHIRVSKADLDAWLAECRHEPASAA
jgi:excisionase family DNA binding protein